MKWLYYIFATLLIVIGFRETIRFFKHNLLVVVNKEDIIREEHMESEDILALRPENYDNAMDLRGTPTHVCVCGCNVFNLKVIFDDFQIMQYFLDMECANCGSLATAPTPVDKGIE
jgi:hypothetical protein